MIRLYINWKANEACNSNCLINTSQGHRQAPTPNRVLSRKWCKIEMLLLWTI